jgi:hypothetical protein
MEKFFKIIERSPMGLAIEYRKKLIEETDPDRIDPGHIGKFFCISEGFAKWLCEEAVRQGAFRRCGEFYAVER